MIQDQNKTLEFLEKVREHLCVYRGPLCDCKFGATNIGGHSEDGPGCPEMRFVIALVRALTPYEYARVVKRLERCEEGRFLMFADALAEEAKKQG